MSNRTTTANTVSTLIQPTFCYMRFEIKYILYIQLTLHLSVHFRQKYYENKTQHQNFPISPYINYAFCVTNYASTLLSSKTMVNSPEYCIYTSVMNTYCVNKKGFQFLSFFIFFHPSLSLFPPLIHLPLSPAPPVSFFFLGSRQDLNQRFPVAPAYLSLCHTTRPRRFVEIPWSKN